jgi:two-component system chemotaxis response regulator CheB
MKRIKVFVIDDSAVVRDILTNKLSGYGNIDVVGSAIDPYIAREKLARLDVDVIVLDIEMPRMDGLTFMKYLMKYRPHPVIIVSSLTDNKNLASIKALELGAIDIVPKPGGPFSVNDVLASLAEKITVAADIDFEKLKANTIQSGTGKKIRDNNILSTISTTHKLIGIGASTGGTNALETLFKGFEKTFPPAIVVIHMPESFTKNFAERLDELCPVCVKEAENNEKVETGCVYVAPGNYHLTVKSMGKDQILKVVKGPQVNHHRPSVDVMFKSIAENVGKNCIGILLTGMGKDGAEGLYLINQQGGFTIAQDEATSIVFGMPKEAIRLGAVDAILPITEISGKIKEHLTLDSLVASRIEARS